MDQFRRTVRKIFSRSSLDSSQANERRPGQTRHYEPADARHSGATNGHASASSAGNQYTSNGHLGATNFRPAPPAHERAHSETRRRVPHEHRAGRLHHQNRVFSLTDVSADTARADSQANLQDADLSKSARATVLQIQFSLFKAMLASVRANNRSTSRHVYLLCQESFQVLEQQLAPGAPEPSSPPAHRVDWPLVQWAMRMLFVLFYDCFGLNSKRLPLNRLRTFVQHLVRILEIEARAGPHTDQEPVPLEVFRELVLVLHRLADHHLFRTHLAESAAKLTKYLVGLACFKYVPVEQELSYVLVRNDGANLRVCHYETREALTLDKIGLVGLIARLQAHNSTRFVVDTLAELIRSGDRAATVFAVKFYHFATQPERQIRLANPAGQCVDQSLAFQMPHCSPLGQLGPGPISGYLNSGDLQLRLLAAQIVGSHAYFHFNRPPPNARDQLSKRAQLVAESVERLAQVLGKASGGEPSLRLACATSLLQCLECRPGTFARQQVDRLAASTKRNLILRCQELIRANLGRSQHAMLLVGRLFDAYPASLEPMAFIFLTTQLKFLAETTSPLARSTLFELLECMLAAARCYGSSCNYSNLKPADRQRMAGQLAKIGTNFEAVLCPSCTPELKQLSKLLGLAPSEPAKSEQRAPAPGAAVAGAVGLAAGASNALNSKPVNQLSANSKPTNSAAPANAKPVHPKPASENTKPAHQKLASQRAANAELAAPKSAPTAKPPASQTTVNGQ